jgi:hypothetical protein
MMTFMGWGWALDGWFFDDSGFYSLDFRSVNERIVYLILIVLLFFSFPVPRRRPG